MEERSLKLPDITPAQIVAIVGSIIGVAVAMGVPLNQDVQDAIVQLVTVLAPILLIADAAIRHGRSRALAPAKPAAVELVQPTVEVAAAAAPAPTVEPDAGVIVTPLDRPGI